MEEFTTTIDRSECAARMFSENSDLNDPPRMPYTYRRPQT